LDAFQLEDQARVARGEEPNAVPVRALAHTVANAASTRDLAHLTCTRNRPHAAAPRSHITRTAVGATGGCFCSADTRAVAQGNRTSPIPMPTRAPWRSAGSRVHRRIPQ
jgi:hypothetical protein